MIKELNRQDTLLCSDFVFSFHYCIDEKSLNEEFFNNPYVHYLIYKTEDKIVGFLNYSQIYDRIEINQFEVLSLYQNQGIGSKLLMYLINLAKENHSQNITLEVRSNNEKAIYLYHKFGFENRAIRSNYYDGIDGILMEKEMVE